MSTVFSRSTRALAADRGRRALAGIMLTAALLGVWGAWAGLARLTVYAVTDTARLEVDRAVHPVEAPVDGRVVATHLALGREVQEGEVLVELEAEAQRLQRDEERSRLTRLRARGLLAEMDLLRAQAEAQRRQAAAHSLELAVERLPREQQTRDSDRKAQLDRLKRELSHLEGQRTTGTATLERLAHEMARRHIRAPLAGRLGEVATLQVGTFVKEGDKLGAVVPPGGLKVVADFLPAVALGRVRAGQPARLRLDSFPWAQYGSLAATVTSVGSEVRDGRVRVELTVAPQPTARMPLQHGLLGTVEVEVERAAPAALVLRAAGQLLATPGTWHASRDGNQGAP